MLYVALLRGINVGGKNTVDMKQLKAVFEDAGMSDVKTYINSGNVIFSSKVRAKAKLVQQIEEGIAKRFGFEVRVVLRGLVEMKALVKAIPSTWTNDQKMRCDVMFLWKEFDRPSVLDQFKHDPKMEDVRYARGAVIWRIDRKDVNRSRMWRGIFGTPLYKQMTIRNCNTVRKLLALMEQ
jgi:uncharacterized protein (DUF1697 family)